MKKQTRELQVSHPSTGSLPVDENKHWELMRLWSKRDVVTGKTCTMDGYLLYFRQEVSADPKRSFLIIKVEKIDTLPGGSSDLRSSYGSPRCSSPETYSSYPPHSGNTFDMKSELDAYMAKKKIRDENTPSRLDEIQPLGVEHVPWPDSDDDDKPSRETQE